MIPWAGGEFPPLKGNAGRDNKRYGPRLSAKRVYRVLARECARRGGGIPPGNLLEKKKKEKS